MKKIGLICATVLLGMALAACGNQSTKSVSSPSKVSSSKVVKHHKKTDKHSTKKQETASSNSSSATSSSQKQDQQVQSNAGQWNSNTNQQQGQANNGQQQAASNNGQLPPSSDLHDFVNRYGESPAAYLSDHYGMSPEQAVQSVPNDMKSSGEIQDTYQLQQGQDPFQ
jgi:hypothetical protein